MRIAAPKLANGEKLDDALLRLLQSPVAVVECLLDLAQRDLLIAGALVPGKRENPVEVRANDLILARGGGQHPHPFGLARRFLEDSLRKVGLLDLAQRFTASFRPARLASPPGRRSCWRRRTRADAIDLSRLLSRLHHARPRHPRSSRPR